MTPERWREVETLFDELVDLTPAERDALLLARTAHDPDLRGEVEKMLDDSERAEAMFEAPPLDVARAVLSDEESDRDHVRPGEIVGAYRIIERIGRGGMGAVYLAERADGHFQKRVALKVVKRGMDTDEILARFRRERQILARLDHPNIAALYDGGMTPTGLPYFVMELVPGDPIDRWCDLRRASVDERLRLFLTVCDAVQYAHRNLVVHRDLKPSNIVVCEGEPKLLDFGIAKMLADEDDEGLQVTRLFSRRLTPEYAAPEQITGEATTTATDVYSLGVLLYELLTGRSPYGDAVGSYTGIENALLQGTARAPSSIVARDTSETPKEEVERLAAARDTRPEILRSRLSGDLDAIVGKALEQEPERRYATAAALGEDIRRHIAGEPVIARPDSALYRWSKFVRRNRKTVGLATAAVAALVLGMMGTVTQMLQARSAEQAASRAADRATAAKGVLLGTLGAFSPELLQGRTTFTRDEIIAMGFAQLGHLDEEPGLQASVINTLAQVAFSMGDLGRADSLFSRAFDLLAVAPNDPERAVSLMGMGEILRSRLVLDSAETLFRSALQLRRRLLPEEHPDRSRSMLALAYALYNQAGADTPDLVQEAERLYLEVLDHKDTLPPDVRGVAYDGLADLRFEQQRFPEAVDNYEKAIEYYRQAFGDEHPAIAWAGVGLGYTYYRMASYGEAERAVATAYSSLERIYGRNHPRVLHAAYILGQILFETERYDQAAEQFRLAAEISAAVYPNGHPYTAQAWQYLGRARSEAGDASAARDAFERALVEHDRVGADARDRQRPLTHYWLGRVYAEQGQWRNAVDQFRAAETLWRAVTRLPPEAVELRSALADAYVALGRPDSAAYYTRLAESASASR